MSNTHHAADHTAIALLQRRYADVVSRRAFGELGELFVPDIHLFMELPGHTKEIVGPDAFGEYVAKRIAHLEFFQFVITNTVAEIDADDDTATGRMWFHELHQSAETHRLVYLYGLYRDVFARIDGRWWFTQRRFAPIAMTSPDEARDLDVFGLDGFGLDGFGLDVS